MFPGKCPSCAGPVTIINGHVSTINISGATHKGVTYHCPSCQAVLGCQLDPITIEQRTVQAVTMEVQKLLQR